MTKKEQFDRIKNYCLELEKTIRKNKQSKKITYGHKTFGLSDNIPFIMTTLILSFAGMGAALSLLAHLPIYIACPASVLTAFGTSIGLPKLIHHLTLKGKGKKARGYAKLEMDSFFLIMKDFYSKSYKHLMKAQSAEEFSQQEIDAFIEQAITYADNYKYYMGKYIGERIFKRNEEDYKKIKKLHDSMNFSNKYQTLAKIEKIVLKNNKFTESWCDLYNTCGRVSKDLYELTKTIYPDLRIPVDKKFMADMKFLNKRVERDFDIHCEGLSTNQSVLDLDFENKNSKQTKSITAIRNELQSKKNQHTEELQK